MCPLSAATCYNNATALCAGKPNSVDICGWAIKIGFYKKIGRNSAEKFRALCKEIENLVVIARRHIKIVINAFILFYNELKWRLESLHSCYLLKSIRYLASQSLLYVPKSLFSIHF